MGVLPCLYLSLMSFIEVRYPSLQKVIALVFMISQILIKILVKYILISSPFLIMLEQWDGQVQGLIIQIMTKALNE